MNWFREITSALSVALLIFAAGLGGAAHALSKDCTGGHCDNAMSMIAEDHHAGHSPGEQADRVALGSNGMEHDECNPFLCNALVLALQSCEAVFDQSEAALAWQVTSLSTLEEPDNPDRPPNL